MDDALKTARKFVNDYYAMVDKPIDRLYSAKEHEALLVLAHYIRTEGKIEQ